MKVRPGLFEFFTVQMTHPFVRRHLLSGAHLPLSLLPPLAASLCVVSAMLGAARRKDISRWIRETVTGPVAAEFGIEPHKYLAARMEEYRVLQESYLAQYNVPQHDLMSFVEVVIGPYRNVFAAAGRAKKLLFAGTDVARGSLGELVAPQDPDLLLASKLRVAYDENITLKVPMLFAELGLAFGYVVPDVATRIAGQDIVVDPGLWSKAREAGLNIPPSPPFHTLSEFTRDLENEVDYFYSLHGDPPGRPPELTEAQQGPWTNRVFGKQVMALFAFRTYQRLFRALKRMRDREQPGA